VEIADWTPGPLEDRESRHLDIPQGPTVHLFIQNDGGAALPLKAESAVRFYLTNQESKVVFDSNHPGSFRLLNYAPIGRTAFKRVSTPTGCEPEAK
jgi:hypothetical protein